MRLAAANKFSSFYDYYTNRRGALREIRTGMNELLGVKKLRVPKDLLDEVENNSVRGIKYGYLKTRLFMNFIAWYTSL